MYAVMILATIFGGLLLILAVIGGTILLGIQLKRGGISPKGRRLQAEDSRIIQEIYQGLSKMEERVEALETILLDREGKERKT